jgi:hypothetical protein
MNEEVADKLDGVVDKTVEAAETAVRRPAIHKIARLGFYAKGFLFLVIGSLAIMLTAGLGEGRIADPTGALAVIANRPLGRILLVAFAIGATGHGLWNLLRAIADVDDAGGDWLGVLKRSIAVGIGLFYVGLALTAIEKLLSFRAAETSSQAEETFVSVLLAVPLLGSALLTIIGLGVIGAGFHECYSGVSGKFREAYRLWEISRPHLAFIMVLGVLSFTARSVVLVMLGYFFVSAAIWDGASGSIGLDAALLTLAQSDYGRFFLFAVAAGLFAHGVLAFYEAKYRRIC